MLVANLCCSALGFESVGEVVFRAGSTASGGFRPHPVRRAITRMVAKWAAPTIHGDRIVASSWLLPVATPPLKELPPCADPFSPPLPALC